MPLYNYKCSNAVTCGVEIEQQRLVADYRKPTLCTTCLEGTLDLQPAAPGFTLRGPGFTAKSGKGRSQ